MILKLEGTITSFLGEFPSDSRGTGGLRHQHGLYTNINVNNGSKWIQSIWLRHIELLASFRALELNGLNPDFQVEIVRLTISIDCCQL